MKKILRSTTIVFLLIWMNAFPFVSMLDRPDSLPPALTKELVVNQIETARGFLSLDTAQTHFAASQTPSFAVKIDTSKLSPWQKIVQRFGTGVANAADLSNQMSVSLLDSTGNKKDEDWFGWQGQQLVANPEKLKPGSYTLQLFDTASGQKISQSFSYGVLVLNTDKDRYSVGESAFIQMGALDATGHTFCTADLSLTIQSGNTETKLSTKDNTIRQSGLCDGNNVVTEADYRAWYTFGKTGIYTLTLKNETNAYEQKIDVLVTDDQPFEIRRSGASRINPFQATYVQEIEVTARHDFSGAIREQIPADFEITDTGGATLDGDHLVWQVVLRSGEKKRVRYTYQAPARSPDVFTLGPLRLQTDYGEIYQEKRQWQLASDAITRLWSSGFELQSTAANVEWEARVLGVPTISTSIKRSGAAAMRTNPTASTMLMGHGFRVNATTKVYARTYLYIASAPTAITTIMSITNNALTVSGGGIRLATDRTLELWNSTTKLGSSSSALSLNTWYRVELDFDDASVNNTANAYLDGASFATGNGTTGTVGTLLLGTADSGTTDLYFDDVAVDTGELPGAGSIVHMKPNATGDSDNGITSPASQTGYTVVDETPPNLPAGAGTDYYIFEVTSDILDVNVESTATVGIGSTDTIRLVQVGALISTATTATATYNTRIKSQAAGTTTAGTSTVHTLAVSATNWRPHDDTASTKGYKLTSLTNPQAGGAWTPALLDTMQIGATVTDDAPDTYMTSLWALVEYIPDVTAPDVQQIHYRWRNDDGSEVAATWAANEDTLLSSLVKGDQYRLRIELANEGTATDGGATHQLEVAETGTCASGTYAAVPTDGSGDWQIVASTHFADGAATTNVASGLTDAEPSFVAGEIKDTGNTTGSITLAVDTFTEIEFSIEATTNASYGSNYCFRLTNTDTYTIYAQATLRDDVQQIHYRWRNDDGTEAGSGGTLNLQVGASADDGDTQISIDNNNSITRTMMPVGNFNGNSHMDAARFNTVTIPQGATITSATYTSTAQATYNCGACTLTANVYLEDVDNSAALTTTNMNEKVLTTANTAWNQTSVVAETEYDVDVTTAVQEVVNRGSWSSGNSMSVLVRDNGSSSSEWQEYYTYDSSPTKAPKLEIVYVSGGGSGATWAEDEDTLLADVVTETQYRLRIELSNEGTSSDGGATHQLEVAETGTCLSGTYAAVPTDTSGDWQIVASTHFVDGAATTNVASGLSDEATTFVAGQVKDTGNTTGSITLAADTFTEIEYSIEATTNATAGGNYCFRLTNTDAYTIYAEASIVGSASTFTLSSYEWYEDNDSENVSAIWGNPDIAENTILTALPATNAPPASGTEIRIRIGITVGTSNLSADTQQFKLQYKAGTDATCTTGSWTDIGAGAGGAIWRFATSGVTDGTNLTVLKISTADVLEEYVKVNPSAVNHNAATIGQEMEYDFHIEHNSAADASSYSFRVVESDDSVFDTYTYCPTLTTRPGMAQLMRHGNFFADQSEKGFIWAD
jgi:hypothetical protein